MLETLRADLAAHRGSPTRRPSGAWPRWRRPASWASRSPPGILVGIGENRADRVAALEAIAASHRRHGHVQEVIVQNFLPKPGTAMHASAAVPARRVPLDRRRGPPASCRPTVHLQAPPNLSDDFGRAARRRHRRLGRRLAGHARPREPRAARGPRSSACGRPPRPRASRWPRGSPSTPSSSSTPSAGSTRRCASPCSTAATPKGWAATTAGTRAARLRPASLLLPATAAGRCAGGARSWPASGRPGGGRRRDRHPVLGPGPRGGGRGRGGRRAAPPQRWATSSPWWPTGTSTTRTSARSSAGSAPSPRARCR